MSIPGLGRFLYIFLTFSLFVDPILHAQNVKINEICSGNYISYEDSYDEKGDWVEFYNPSGSSINMAGMYLTDDLSNLTKFQIPGGSASSTTISAHNYLVFWFDDETYKGPTHANFKLSSNGDELALVASNGTTIIDSITFSFLTYDVTYGRTTDGSSSWSYFPIPTPDDENSGGGYAGITDKASFNMDAGFYSSSIQVTLSTPEPSSTIYYSLNGNEPSPSKGILYTGPVTISSTRAMRARVYRSNYIPGEVTTRTYFINRTTDLPVLSVVTDSANLWDENTGIYTFGVDDYDHFYPYYGANFWHGWKRVGHIELFEASGAEVVSQNLKISLSGNTSRVYAQKSFNFEAEDALGKKSISYQLFPQIPVYEYKAFKVRNGGSDWSSTGIRDAFNHTILEGAMDVDHQSNRPVVLYLNGDYWGVISMTEKIDEDYLNGHFPSIDKDSVDLLFSNAEVANGNPNDYNALISFIGSNSLSQQSNYNYVKSQMDVQEYMNYFQSRIYFASTDWPNKNIYYWRPQDKSMKWRWIMWDTDRSDLLSTSPNHPCNVNHNTLAWATTSGSVASWAQFLLNNLLLNAEFRSQFITQYAHHMNFTFCPIRTDSVLNVFRSRLHNELPAHINRWKNSNDTIDYFTQGFYQSRTEWNKEVDTMKIFFDNRAGYMRSFIKSQFGISGTSEITLAKVPSNGGYLKIDTFFVPSNACDLEYFDGYPVTITAMAAPGYIFNGWTSSGGSTLPLIWNPRIDTTVTAYFILNSATQPTAPSTDYSAVVSNCTDIQLNWTPGNGSSRMVVAKAGSAVNVFPVDQQGYSSSSIFGNGSNLGGGNFVVYSGSASSCTVTGLSQGVTYHFAIIEFNGSSVTSNYNTSNFLVGNTTTNSFSVTASATSNSICFGSASSITALGGMSYAWTPASGLSATTGSTVVATPLSSTDYTVQATNVDGCTSSIIVPITVYPLPSVSLSNFSNVCVSSTSLTLSGGSPSGGAYSGTAVSGSIFNASAAGVGSHVITYTYTNSNGCLNTAAKSITVGAIPNVVFNSLNDICLNASAIVLNGGTPSGGTYSGIGVSGNTFNPANAGVGNHILTYTYNSGCSASDTSVIKVKSLPIVDLNVFSPACSNSAPIMLSGGTPGGGVYSGPGVSGNTFNPSIAGIGNKVITYTYATIGGCSNSDTSGIIVNSIPVVDLPVFSNVCVNSASVILSGGNPSGGNYSGTAVNSGIFSPSSAGIGNHVITYTYTNGNGCTNFDTSGIFVSGIPSVSLSAFNPVCVNSSPIILSGGSPSGGIYSGTGVSGGVFSPGIAGLGTHMITYTFNSGCVASATSMITVNAAPTVSLAPLNDICVNDSPIVLTGGVPAGGTYSGTGVISGVFNPGLAGGGAHTITYTYSNGSGCSNSDHTSIFVNAPTVNLSALNSVCINSLPFVLNAGAPTGGTYSGTGIVGAQFDPQVAGVGSHLVTYTYTNSSGCTGSDTSSIFVGNIPTVNFSNLNDVCENSAPILLTGGTPVGGIYSGSGVSAGFFNPAIAGTGNHIITYTYNLGCTDSDTSNILVIAAPVVQLGSFNDVCLDSSTIALTGGLPSGGVYSGTGVINGNFVPIVAGKGTHDIIYFYTNNVGCSDSDTSSILVDAPAVSLSALSDLCINSSPIVLSGGSPATGVYSGTGVSGGTFDPMIAGIGGHVITYTYSNSSGCIGADTASIYVHPVPTANLSAFNSVCLNSSPFVLSGGTPAGGIYSGAGISGGFFDPAIAGIGSHSVSYEVFITSGCHSEDTSSIVVNENPIISLGNDTTICAYHNLVLDAGSGLNSYLWSTGDTSQVVTVDSTGNGLGMVIYSVTGTNNFGCSTDASIKVTYDICAGINDGTGLPSILVFPNPFSEEIMIVSDEDNLTFSLYNILGEVIFRKSIHAKSFNLKPNVTPGIYFLFIETSHGSETVKLVKTHSSY